jgi:hypothetical protein
MNHRALFCLAVSTCLVACAVRTTSLGGPQGNQSSASSTDAGDGTESGASAPAPASDASVAAPFCAWYSWSPVPTTVACEYFLPSDDPNSDPNYDPRTWDPHNVRVEFASKNVGEYAASSDGCGSAGGWYYSDPSDAQTQTRFMLCPESCARVMADGGFLAMAAKSCPLTPKP